jgi:hypothetical protein
MKKITIFLAFLLFSISAVYAFLQSDTAQNYIRKVLVEKLASSGIEANIGQIQGALPGQIHLKNVAVQADGLEVEVREIQLKPILWRFFKNELAFKDVQAKSISISKSAPFDFSGKFWLTQKKARISGLLNGWTLRATLDQPSGLISFKAKNDLVSVVGNAVVDSQYELVSAKMQFSSDDLLQTVSPLLKGRILGTVSLTNTGEKIRGEGEWQIPKLTANDIDLGKVKGEIYGTFKDSHLLADLTADNSLKASLNWQFQPGMLITGESQISIENLHRLGLPDTFGKLSGQMIWSVEEEKQTTKFDAKIDQFYYRDLFAEEVHFFTDLEKVLDVDFKQMNYNDLRLDTLSASAEKENGAWPFQINAEGEWKHPLAIHSEGVLQTFNKVRIETFSGFFFNHPFELTKSVDFTISEKEFLLPDVNIRIEDTLLFANIERREENSTISIQCDRLPLDFLSLNPLDVPVQGEISLKADIREVYTKLNGNISVDLIQTEPFEGKGSFQGSFSRNQLQLKGTLDTNGSPIAKADISVPIHFSIWPFTAKLLPYGEVSGNIAFDGQVENVLDFFDLGPHRLEGKCKGQLHLKNTLHNPKVDGFCTFENGFYENYYTGTKLHNIQAEITAEKNIAYLRSFHAIDDPKDGFVSALGQVKLTQTELYPFHFEVTLNDFQISTIDLVSAATEGKIDITGNLTSALASGTLLLTESILTIPDHIKQPLPELNVVYINPDHPVPLPTEQDTSSFPLYLDLQVVAPDVLIMGRGVDSTWQGNFHVGGSFTNIAMQGKLQLLEGEFSLAGKSFQLDKGSISFSGVEHEMPRIDLSAVTETKGITITAQLHGPLDNPQITLYSNPPLPLGSIMSYLLFGQELSEISGFQALELISSLTNLAGSGPDMLESTRQALGVDRLRIITQGDEESGETVALEVGKYISDGVLVTFTQNVQESSINIKIEFELRGNFILVLENDQYQEQGKFTLKWRVNY